MPKIVLGVGQNCWDVCIAYYEWHSLVKYVAWLGWNTKMNQWLVTTQNSLVDMACVMGLLYYLDYVFIAYNG